MLSGQGRQKASIADGQRAKEIGEIGCG